MASEVAQSVSDRIRVRLAEARLGLEQATERAISYPHLFPAATVSSQAGFIAGLEEALMIADGAETPSSSIRPCGSVHGDVYGVNPHGGPDGHVGPSLGCCVCVSLRWIGTPEHTRYVSRWPA